MVATVVLGMLCVHLLCFSGMFMLISTRLRGRKMGTDVFAIGSLLLGLAYVLQLLDAPRTWGLMSVVNHTLTLCAPVAYGLGAARFFDRPVSVVRPLLALAGGYTVAQVLVQAMLGSEARYALLAAACALLFVVMAVVLLYGMRTFARHLRAEMAVFAALIGGLGAMNAAKCVLILSGGLDSLDMGHPFQTAFYIYMSFLGTVLPPAVVWLVLHRLTDDLRVMAVHDPLTGVLNRRGLADALDAYFRSRPAAKAHLLMVDIDHFKRINDTYGHKAGDIVLRAVAAIIQRTARQGDLTCRLGGEEFVVIALDTDSAGAMQLAERVRDAIEHSEFPGVGPHGPIRCTVTLGLTGSFASMDALDASMQQADAALYRGKRSGRNRVEWAQAPEAPGQPA
ncbi:sensor domain-containing diguanylate cyclase [Acidovorax radicis]|jgi:diguanylate cyclase (GGDEF)-like protein|uniref:GGDEF domain-containing protein n=1 Tax=Acidovorax radicis TaxID=758826 RepID=UPI001CF8AE68|nr:GGDEF domain-containing protein [Acidovorax radicis]UCU99441.1 GGDEF domain-containing protein [Acidovorax radicis]